MVFKGTSVVPLTNILGEGLVVWCFGELKNENVFFFSEGGEDDEMHACVAHALKKNNTKAFFQKSLNK